MREGRGSTGGWLMAIKLPELKAVSSATSFHLVGPYWDYENEGRWEKMKAWLSGKVYRLAWKIHPFDLEPPHPGLWRAVGLRDV